ncbi:hypothetical protein SCUP234_00857 [Seiridium cupressi]
MASIADPVTIDRAYFETLVRRATFLTKVLHQDNGDHTALSEALADQNLTVVSTLEYDNLILLARQFATLRANLITGGIDEETISLLSHDDPSLRNQQGTDSSVAGPPTYSRDGYHGRAKLTTEKPKPIFNPEARFFPALGHRQRNYNGYSGGLDNKINNNDNTPIEWADVNGDGFSAEYSPDGYTPETQHNDTFGQFGREALFDRPHYPRMCKRTIVLAGIPDSTTHEDITKVIRGGPLLEVYIRGAEHSALVSFLREEDAVRFYEHSRKNDLYINHKRVFIKWADRHFHLAGHVAGKIAQGATRNMVIRRCDPNHTEDSIRDDLEHIHNLIVVKVEFISGSCYIKTNSVHNAMFARTCMMSRAKYKGSKIDWDVDECEQPLQKALKPLTPKPQREPPMKKPAVKIRNRFATLRLDDDDNDNESDDRFDTSTEFAVSTTVDVSA